MLNFILIIAAALSPSVQLAHETAYAMGRCHVYIEAEAKVYFWRDVNSNDNEAFREAISDSYYKGIEDSRKDLPTLEQCQAVFKTIKERMNNVDN